jgi:2'-hydroxyisoflavone reductase
MNRRDAIRSAGLVAAAMLSGGAARAASKPMRVLILGGTGFIGPHFVEVLRAASHSLTLFNRGRRNPTPVRGVESLTGDRNGKVDALKGRDWDVVIDNSGYTPRQVQLTVDLLKDHVQHYIFISSISVYADLAKPGIDENYALAKLQDPNTEQVTGETYGGLKALCEQVVERAFGSRCAVIRPTYIVGPGDNSDRFTYWPVRVARGGEMLAPGRAGDPIQFIDVRDLAAFMRLCVEQRSAGRYNACNSPRAVTMGQLLDTSKRLTGSNAQFVWADAQFLADQKLVDSGEIPIWAPPAGEYAGAALVSSTRAVDKGMRFRPLEVTVRDTLEWHAKRPAGEQQKLRAGLSHEREAQLLAQLRARA